MDKVVDTDCEASGSGFVEEGILNLSEQQVNTCVMERSYSISTENMRVPEKRVREDSEEVLEDEDGFITVRRGNKKQARRSSENSHSSTNGDRNVQEGYVVSITGKDKVLPKQFGLAKLLKSENIMNINKVQYKNAYKVIVEFVDRQNAEKLVKCQKLLDLGFRCQFADEINLSYGVVKQIDLNIEVEEIQQSVESEYEVVSVRRLKRLGVSREWVDSETVRLCFKSSTLPPYVSMYGCRFKVEPYMFPVTQCSGCWRYGHLIKSCPTKVIRCPKCGEGHSNCDTTNYKCINCKMSHMALEKSCPIFIKEKQIRKIMCEKNFTYRKALSSYLEHRKTIAELQTENEITPNKSNCCNNDKTSYRDILVTNVRPKKRIEVRYEQEINNEDRGDLSMGAENSLILGKSGRKETKKKKNSGQSFHATLDNDEEGPYLQQQEMENREKDTTKSTVDFKGLLRKLKEVCLTDCSFEVKLKLICNFVFEHFFQLVWRLLKEGDVYNKIFSMFKDGLFT